MSLWSSKISHVLMCDIGGSSLGMALVIEGAVVPEIVYSYRREFDSHEDDDDMFVRLRRALDEGFRDVLTSPLQARGQNERLKISISRIHCVLSAPWYAARIKTTRISKDENFLVTRKLVKDILLDEEKAFEREAAAGLSEEHFRGGLHMIERGITKVVLNGYETEMPFEKEAHTVDITLFMGIVSHELLTVVRDAGQKHFHIGRTNFSTFPSSVSSAVRTLLPHDTDALLFRISKDTTEAVTISGGSIDSVEVHPLGFGALIKKTEEQFGVPASAAHSLLHITALGEADDATRESVLALGQSFLGEWAETVLKNFAAGSGEPIKVIVTADEPIGTMFKEQIESFSKNFHTFALSPELFKNQILIRGSRFDGALALAVLGEWKKHDTD